MSWLDSVDRGLENRYVTGDPFVQSGKHAGQAIKQKVESLGNKHSVQTPIQQLGDVGVLQSLGNIVTGNLDFKRSIESAIRAERFSAREAEKTRRWQEQMSNSAYSRAIADLKRNGINPYAIGYFSPASTPSGATGSAYNTSPHSAAANALGALGLVERAYSNSKKREIEERSNLLRLVFAFLSGGD